MPRNNRYGREERAARQISEDSYTDRTVSETSPSSIPPIQKARVPKFIAEGMAATKAKLGQMQRAADEQDQLNNGAPPFKKRLGGTLNNTAIICDSLASQSIDEDYFVTASRSRRRPELSDLDNPYQSRMAPNSEEFISTSQNRLRPDAEGFVHASQTRMRPDSEDFVSASSNFRQPCSSTDLNWEPGSDDSITVHPHPVRRTALPRRDHDDNDEQPDHRDISFDKSDDDEEEFVLLGRPGIQPRGRPNSRRTFQPPKSPDDTDMSYTPMPDISRPQFPIGLGTRLLDSTTPGPLFEPKDEPTLATPRASTESDSSSSVPRGRKRKGYAHELKQKLLAGNKAAHPYARKRAPENDPENRMIKRMRQNERKHWTDIVTALNQERIRQGRAPTFTQAAVYGRFSRVAPRIAEADGEEGFDYKDYLHYKYEPMEPTSRPVPPMPVFSQEQENQLVNCYKQVEEERWTNVAAKFKLVAGLDITADQAARKFRSI